MALSCLLATASGQINDVPSSIEAIGTQVTETIQFRLPGDSLPEGGHLQGVQWMHGRILLSGSSTGMAYFLTVDPKTKNSILTHLLPSPLRHAGGFQLHEERFAAVGIEDNHTRDHSRILLLDMQATPPGAATIAPLVDIERKGEVKRSTAGAVALTAYQDHHILMVGTWDSATIDLYKSNGLPLTNNELDFEQRETWSASEANRDDWCDPNYGSYQNIQFLSDTNGHLYLAAFCRHEEVDRLDLFEVRLSQKVPLSKRLRKHSSKCFECRKTTFQAGAGIRPLQDGSLSVYACSHREGVVEVFR